MKNKLKILFLIICIIFLTGCSGNYNLKINDDLSIDEELELTVENSNNAYNNTLKIFEDNNIDKEKYNVSLSSNEVNIKYNDSFESFEDYLMNSKVYHQMFDDIQYNRTKKYIDLYASDNIKLKNEYTINNGSNLTDFDVIQVNITNPYKVSFSNAEIVNNNTYTWSIRNDDNEKLIQMQFKTALDKVPYKPIIVGLLILIVSAILIFNFMRRYKNRNRV